MSSLSLFHSFDGAARQTSFEGKECTVRRGLLVGKKETAPENTFERSSLARFWQPKQWLESRPPHYCKGKVSFLFFFCMLAYNFVASFVYLSVTRSFVLLRADQYKRMFRKYYVSKLSLMRGCFTSYPSP